MLVPLALSIALLTGVAAVPIATAAPAGAQTDGPSKGVVYTARKGPAEVRLVGLGEAPNGDELVLLDLRVECGGFRPEARLVGVVEEDGRFEVEGPVSDSGTTEVITGDFEDIDGKVRSDGALLEIDIEVSGVDDAGPTGRCEETQPWRLEPRRSSGAGRIDGAVPTEATRLASNGDALFTLGAGELARVDPQTLETTWTVEVSVDANALAAAGDAVWVLDADLLELTRIDPLSGDEVTTVPLETPERAAVLDAVLPEMTASDVGVWVAVDEAANLYRVDAATNALEVGTLLGEITALAPAPAGVYVAFRTDSEAAPFVRLDPGVVPVAAAADALAAAGQRVWARSANIVSALAARELFLVPEANVEVGVSPIQGEELSSAAPGVWTTTERGIAIVDEANARAGSVPVVGAGATGLVSAEGDVFVLDAGHLVRLDAV